ncbi:unnamed protein product [Lymnaea stagnalis]|uniref:Serine protease HTRA2, mitochondrial n=1 Tax=Lymnaea stagnalis TaxID=6523 RepID=A0AAV2HU20_LYMST
MFFLKRSISRPLESCCIRFKGSGFQIENVERNTIPSLSLINKNKKDSKGDGIVFEGHQSPQHCSPSWFMTDTLQPRQLSINKILKSCFHRTADSNNGSESDANAGNSSKSFRGTGAIAGTCLGLTLAAYFYSKEHGVTHLLGKPVYADSKNKNNFIADVVEKAGPAVVFLEIKGRHPITGRPVTLSNGSGFIVRSNGIILTNAHVVANKSTVSVKLQDGRVMEGQVTAVDPISDLATVKIAATNLPIIPLGTSSTIRPGEWVIAMGSPLSLSNTVTCGIVSSVQRASRELGLRNKDMDYIQTDAVINFGNSGGPLVNLDGQAIGINTMKVTTGISFAIPSDYAIKFLTKAEELMKNGRRENGFLKRRYMGITMLTLTENVMRDLKNNIKLPNFPDVDGGVFVYKVIPGSPANIGGILAGDIIIDINGSAIKSAADVYDAVEKSDFLTVTLIRGSEKKMIPINTKQTI